jgi:NarL family two-component system response regulator LiaR
MSRNGHVEPVNMVRLLMIDDQLMLAEALSSRLGMVPDLWVVGRCTTVDPRLLDVVGRTRPDVITLDVEPVSDTEDLVDKLKEARPTAEVVVLSGVLDVRKAVQAARAGALSWVSKGSGIEELIAVLRGAAQGHSWFPPELLGPVLRELRETASGGTHREGPLSVLSERERDVLRGMVAGKRCAQIAEELLISTETVRTHTRSILAKLQVHSQLEAVSVACAAGLSPRGRTSVRKDG